MSREYALPRRVARLVVAPQTSNTNSEILIQLQRNGRQVRPDAFASLEGYEVRLHDAGTESSLGRYAFSEK